jgi:hypothetical protein
MNADSGASYSCTYPLRSRLTREDADRIAQAAVYLADSIYIPASAAIDPAANEEERLYIYRRLSELRDIGAVSLWRAEDGVQLSTGELQAVSGQPDVTIERERYRELYAQVMSRLVENRDHFRGSESFDGIAEVVEGKHTLFLFGLKDLLKSNALLLDNRASDSLSRYFGGLTEQLVVAEDVVRQLALRLHLPDIGELRVDQIEALRQHMPAFRARLLRAVGDEQLLLAEREEMIERLTNVLIDEFFDYVSSMREKRPPRTASPGRVWKLKELVLAPVLGRANAHRFFGWGGAPTTPPELILMELHKIKASARRTGRS